MTDTLVFIPAWNEEENLPAVLEELRRELPDADVLVVDDGSTDRTAEVARAHGAEVLSLGSNRGLQIGIAAGYRWALEHDYAYCGRIDADGQHPAAELRGCSHSCARAAATSRSARASCRATVTSPTATSRARRGGLVRRSCAAMGVALRRPFADATSGLYAVNAAALPHLAEPFTSRRRRSRPCSGSAAPGLRVAEVPVTMEQRASGESKLQGSKAVRLVLTVIGTLVAGRFLWSRRHP